VCKIGLFSLQLIRSLNIIDKSTYKNAPAAKLNASFLIPNNIPKHVNNHTFPFRLIVKIISNGETYKRDWLCWRTEKQKQLCAPSFLINNNAANTSN